MIYYRTHASRTGEHPPELVGWTPPNADPQLSEQTIGEHRVLGIVPKFVFAPPVAGWVKIAPGWEAVVAGEMNLLWHAKMSSQWKIVARKINDQTWLLPIVLTNEGRRAFKVTYGGQGFDAQMTPEQSEALALATEIRTAYEADALPEYKIRAQWAAKLLGLTYHLSPATVGIIGIHEEVIDAALLVAGGISVGDD